MQTPMHSSQADDGFYDLCFLSCISHFSNSWQKLHLHLSATKDERWYAHKPACLELSELTPALTMSFCRGHLLLLWSVTRPWCAQFHSCHTEYFKRLGFFAKSEHIYNPRDHLRTKPVQEKACFYFGTAAWSKRVQIPGLSQLELVYGGG